MVAGPLFDLGRCCRAHLYILPSGCRLPVRQFGADAPASGPVQFRLGRMVAARDIQHEPVGVLCEPSEVASVIVAEFVRAHQSIFGLPPGPCV